MKSLNKDTTKNSGILNQSASSEESIILNNLGVKKEGPNGMTAAQIILLQKEYRQILIKVNKAFLELQKKLDQFKKDKKKLDIAKSGSSNKLQKS